MTLVGKITWVSGAQFCNLSSRAAIAVGVATSPPCSEVRPRVRAAILTLSGGNPGELKASKNHVMVEETCRWPHGGASSGTGTGRGGGLEAAGGDLLRPRVRTVQL